MARNTFCMPTCNTRDRWAALKWMFNEGTKRFEKGLPLKRFWLRSGAIQAVF